MARFGQFFGDEAMCALSFILVKTEDFGGRINNKDRISVHDLTIACFVNAKQ
jgi:hypothetical protein